MRIRLSLYDGKSPVELLDEDQGAKLVRKRHARKGQTQVRLFDNVPVKPVRAADNEDNPLLAAGKTFSIKPENSFDENSAPLSERATTKSPFARDFLMETASLRRTSPFGRGGL